jgi:hypothetical protein
MEFNTGGTADSSNSGAMTGGTMASSMYKNGGGVGKLNGKPFSFYKYDTKKVKIAWKGKIQPFGAFYSVEDAIEELKNHYQTQQELREYSIVTPDGIIHYGKEYPIRYAKGGGLKPIPKGNKGLPKLPKSVRNKMGYMAKGGGVGKMEWGGTAESSETGEFIGGENQSSMFENGGVSTGFTYDIGGL